MRKRLTKAKRNEKAIIVIKQIGLYDVFKSSDYLTPKGFLNAVKRGKIEEAKKNRQP